MMARRVGGDASRPPQVMKPCETGISPMAARNSVVLPEPFGPIRTVGGPLPSVSVTRSRIVTSPATIVTSTSINGRSMAGGRMVIPRSVRRRGARPRRVR